MSLVTIVTSGFERWATKSHAGAWSSTEEQPLKPPQASNLSATNPCHLYTSTAGSTSTPGPAELPTCVPHIGNKPSSGSGNALKVEVRHGAAIEGLAGWSRARLYRGARVLAAAAVDRERGRNMRRTDPPRLRTTHKHKYK